MSERTGLVVYGKHNLELPADNPLLSGLGDVDATGGSP